MKRLILSVAVYLLVIDLPAVNATETLQNASHQVDRNNPVIVAGFFGDILRNVEELNNTIRGVRNTVDEVNRLRDDMSGKETQSPPANQPNPTNSPTQPETKLKPDQKRNNDEPPTNSQEQVQPSPSAYP
jgi:hypothetical protein